MAKLDDIIELTNTWRCDHGEPLNELCVSEEEYEELYLEVKKMYLKKWDQPNLGMPRPSLSINGTSIITYKMEKLRESACYNIR